MRLNVRKELHLTPWDLVCALRKAGLVDEDCCVPDIKIVEKTDVNEGRTVIVAWSRTEAKIGREVLEPQKDTLHGLVCEWVAERKTFMSGETPELREIGERLAAAVGDTLS